MRQPVTSNLYRDTIQARLITRRCWLNFLAVAYLVLPLHLAQAAFVDSANSWSNSLNPLLILDKHNPGQLSASLYKVAESKNLVVLLHGCGQSSMDFAVNGGFFSLADRHQVNLLLIEQIKQNNPQACFNWFSKSDTQIEQGEHASINAFILEAESQLSKPQSRYLFGLSAGAAMANALYAQQHEKYDGLAVIAGIPFPCAQSLVQAISCMKTGSNVSGKSLAELLPNVDTTNKSQLSKDSRSRGNHIVVITGTEDSVVAPVNSEQTVEQYKYILNLNHIPRKEVGDNYVASFYRQQSGHRANNKPAHKVDFYQVPGMGHGLPIDTQSGLGERVAPYFLDVGVSASSLVFKAWFDNQQALAIEE